MVTLYDTTGAAVTVRDTSGRVVFGPSGGGSNAHVQQIASRAHTCSGVQHAAAPGQMSATYRTPHEVRADGANLRLVYNHVGYLAALISPMPNPITVAASIEHNGELHPLTFAGADRVTITGGTHATTDPLDIDVTTGEVLHVRTYVEVTEEGHQWGLSSYDALSADEGGGITWGEDLTRTGTVDPVGTPSWSTRAYWPQAILAEVEEPTKVLIPMGSSSTAGISDTYRHSVSNTGGFGVRAADLLGVPYTHAANGGDAYRKRNSSMNAMHYPPAVLAGATHAFGNFGANDWAQTRPLLGMQREAIAFWRWMDLQGVKYWQCTLTPYSTSTDGWMTLDGQTPHVQDWRRAEFNDWVRDGAPLTGTEPDPTGIRIGHSGHPLGGYIETADISESSRNSGIWRLPNSDGTPAPSDGQHFNDWMHELLAQAIAQAFTGG